MDSWVVAVVAVICIAGILWNESRKARARNKAEKAKGGIREKAKRDRDEAYRARIDAGTDVGTKRDKLLSRLRKRAGR